MLNLLCFGKELEVQEMLGRLLHVEQVLGATRILGCDRVVMVWCRDRGSLCRNMVLRL